MFPQTAYSVVVLAASEDPEARRGSVARLAATYYPAVYAHLRRKWRLAPEGAEDLAQAFFASVVERNVFAAYRLERGRFRTFVRTCLDHLVESDLRAARRLKRGGAQQVVTYDTTDLESELVASPDADPDGAFDREFVRALFASAITAMRERLERAGKAHYFTLFERYDLSSSEDERPTYAVLAKELGIGTTDVTNHLHFARKEFRRAVVEELRQLTRSEEELREEAAELGIDVDAVS